MGETHSRFTYQHNGEQKESKIKLNLSIVSDLEILKSHPLKNIEIISHVKVCDFHLNDNDLLLEIYEEILTNTGINFTLDAKALEVLNRMVGFIICDDLSSVLDGTGMPAKDLSHHTLRKDHPITIPFLKCAYKAVIDFVRAYLHLGEDEKQIRLDNMVLEVADFIYDSEDIDDLASDPEDLEDSTIDSNVTSDISQDILNKAKQATKNKNDFNPNKENRHHTI